VTLECAIPRAPTGIGRARWEVDAERPCMWRGHAAADAALPATVPCLVDQRRTPLWVALLCLAIRVAYGMGAGTRCFDGDPALGCRSSPNPVPHGEPSCPDGGAMATQPPICHVGSRRIVFGASTILGHGEMAHQTCQALARSVNAWADGTRHLVCLSCDRAFESDSKAQRLCRACR
jgi:hypothetical protein